MRKALLSALLTPLLALSTACASSGAADGSSRPRRQADRITQEEIEQGHYDSAYTLVQALRSNWLSNRGPDTITGTPTQVQVYLDDIRYGGVEALRRIHPMTIGEIRHFSGIAASGRWGLDHGAGVIYVLTRKQ